MSTLPQHTPDSPIPTFEEWMAERPIADLQNYTGPLPGGSLAFNHDLLDDRNRWDMDADELHNY